jgi:hypothetical protein
MISKTSMGMKGWIKIEAFLPANDSDANGMIKKDHSLFL